MIDQFKQFLLDQKGNSSKTTVKNYIADVRKFIEWYKGKYNREFEPQNINFLTIEEFKKDKSGSASASSVDRYLSTLRKFFFYLKLEGIVSYTPFEIEKNNKLKNDIDPWHIKDFKNYLYIYNASHLTIKNYIIDVRQFLTWAEQVTSVKSAWEVKDKNIFDKIDNSLIGEYKRRLVEEFKFSPLSVNRKLSSLRKYLAWIKTEGLIKDSDFVINNLESKSERITPSEIPVFQKAFNDKPKAQPKSAGTYSPIPPVRLAQKSGKGLVYLFDIVTD
ncbi:MAG: site-specific integrase, partial [Patescibacteria group bacterium]|nr:site-specific integrase [Patescibacteria group bacterium]